MRSTIGLFVPDICFVMLWLGYFFRQFAVFPPLFICIFIFIFWRWVSYLRRHVKFPDSFFFCVEGFFSVTKEWRGAMVRSGDACEDGRWQRLL